MVAKVVAFVLGVVFGQSRWFELIDTLGDLAIIVGTLIVALRLFVKMKAAMLWRVRRKLTLSYIFMGFVPALLIIVFFMVAGLLLFLNIGAYMMRSELTRLVDSTRFAAESAALGVARESTAGGVSEALQLRRAVLASRYPGASVTLVPSPGRCRRDGGSAIPPERLVIGPWKHLSAPDAMPGWIPCDGFAALFMFDDHTPDTQIVARAVVWPKGGNQAVIVDVPVDEAFKREMLERSGVVLKGVSEVQEPTSDSTKDSSLRDTTRSLSLGAGGTDGRLMWIGEVDAVEWDTGARADLLASFGTSLGDVYHRLALTNVSRLRNYDIGRLLIPCSPSSACCS